MRTSSASLIHSVQRPAVPQCHAEPRGANAAQMRQVRFIGSVEQSARDLGSRWFQRL